MAKNASERICSQCGVINKEVINNCSICGGDLNTISIKNYFDIKQVILSTFVPLLWVFLIMIFFNFFGLVNLKEITPILRLVSNFIILTFVVTFSYLFIKLGGEWHAVGVINNGFRLYNGFYTKIIKVANYNYSDIEVFCKIITPRYVSVVFKAMDNIETDSFVTKNIELGKKIIKNFNEAEISAREFEKRFSVVTGF